MPNHIKTQGHEGPCQGHLTSNNTHHAAMATMAEEETEVTEDGSGESRVGSQIKSDPMAIRLDSFSNPLSAVMQHNMLCHRQRHLSYSPSTRRRMEAILGTSPPSPMRLPRDADQPRMGSIPDIHREGGVADDDDNAFDEDNEVRDTFSEAASAFRPRSKTCPENRTWARRAKARTRAHNLNRPPTPPPGGADDCDMEQQLSRLALKGKLKIPARDLPEVVESQTDSNIVEGSKPVNSSAHSFPIEGV